VIRARAAGNDASPMASTRQHALRSDGSISPTVFPAVGLAGLGGRVIAAATSSSEGVTITPYISSLRVLRALGPQPRSRCVAGASPLAVPAAAMRAHSSGMASLVILTGCA